MLLIQGSHGLGWKSGHNAVEIGTHNLAAVHYSVNQHSASEFFGTALLVDVVVGTGQDGGEPILAELPRMSPCARYYHRRHLDCLGHLLSAVSGAHRRGSRQSPCSKSSCRRRFGAILFGR